MRCQWVVTALLVYATWITVKCPCATTLGCHKREFFLSLGVAAGLVLHENGMLRVLR